MNKVYVVTAGEYSSYHIEGVFSTKELADAHVTKLARSDADVTEWDVDDLENLIVGHRYTSSIDLISGEISRREPERLLIEPGKRVPDIELDPKLYHHDGITSAYRWVHRTSYVSQEHADKLAIELRQRLLREWGGLDNFKLGRNDSWMNLKHYKEDSK